MRGGASEWRAHTDTKRNQTGERMEGAHRHERKTRRHGSVHERSELLGWVKWCESGGASRAEKVAWKCLRETNLGVTLVQRLGFVRLPLPSLLTVFGS